MIKVSIVIPVYKAEKTIKATLDSIADQTYPDIEVVAVDDCSPDSSIELLQSFKKEFESPSRSVVICRHEKNQGVAAARNTALSAATGDYICYVDADDCLGQTAVEKAVASSQSGMIDIVGWDWYLCQGESKRYMSQRGYSTPVEALKNCMEGVMRWNLWLFMVKRDLYIKNDIKFIPGKNMGEDMMVMLKLFMCAGSVYHIREAFYLYAQTDSSISKVMSDKNISEVTANVNEVDAFFKKSRPSEIDEAYLHFLKLNVKLPLLITCNIQDYRRWYNWFSESNSHVMENTALPFRTRLLQKMAGMKLWPLVWIYNKIVYGIMYKLIYQ